MSEFRQFLETLRRLGIEHSIDWQPTKDAWQQIILDAGYNVTAIACTVVTVAEVKYLFCNGSVGWTEKEEGIGPEGLLLFSRKKSGEVISRMRYSGLTYAPLEEKNLRAIEAQYPADWSVSRVA